MKKFTRSLALASICAMLTFQSFSQSFTEGDNTISVGYGFPNLAKSYFSVWDDANLYDRSEFGGFGPMHIKFEHALNDKLGIGISMNLVSADGKYEYESTDINGNATTFTDEFSMTGWSALVRLNWHFLSSEKFDPYWGIGVGYRTAKWEYSYGDPDSSEDNITAKTLVPLGLEITVGARYYVTEKFALYAETGIAKSIFQIGLAYRIPGI